MAGPNWIKWGGGGGQIGPKVWGGGEYWPEVAVLSLVQGTVRERGGANNTLPSPPLLKVCGGGIWPLWSHPFLRP